jgi:REP element-mobilizing transposase RayT
MKYNPDVHHRRSIRLKNYDYSQAGAYFITLCVQNRECVFGEIVDRHMHLSPVGENVFLQWTNLPQRFAGLELDAFVVMPNHFHAIILINPVGQCAALGAASGAPTLGRILRAFKSISAIEGNRLLNRSNQFFWQRNYWEHVIRNEKELMTLRQYILSNPAQWELDSLYM